MLDTIGAFGSGIGTNLLSDSLSKKLEAFKDKKAIASFTQSLRDWEIEFEKQNDGTIITNGTCQEKVDTKKGKITGSPVRSCTELGFCSPRQQPDGDD